MNRTKGLCFALLAAMPLLLLSGCNSTTYHQHAKPILEANCVSCHTAGESVPYTMNSYAEVSAIAPVMRLALTTGIMPPWPPSTDCNRYEHERLISDADKATLIDWIDGGALEGTPMEDSPAEPAELPLTVRDDITLTMSTAYTPANLQDDYRCFLIPWQEEESVYVTGFEVFPGRRELVHHVLVYAAPPSLATALQEADGAEEGPGYTCYGGPTPSAGSSMDQSQFNLLGTWVPGTVPSRFPAGSGILVEAGTTLVMQLHYNMAENPAVPDETSIAFETEQNVEKPGVTFLYTDFSWLGGGTMLIPAGEPAVNHRSELPLGLAMGFLGHNDRIGVGFNDPFVIHGAGLHMHELGKSASVTVKRPGEEDKCLIQIDDWDFNWQGQYQFQEPFTFRSDDRLVLECTWDNSALNQPTINGVKRDPVDMDWGDGTQDEMCLVGLYVTAP